MDVYALNSFKGLVGKKMYYDNDCLELSLVFVLMLSLTPKEYHMKFKFVRNEIL